MKQTKIDVINLSDMFFPVMRKAVITTFNNESFFVYKNVASILFDILESYLISIDL